MSLTQSDLRNLPKEALAAIAFSALETLRTHPAGNINQIPLELYLELKLWQPQYSREMVCFRGNSEIGIQVLLVSSETRVQDDVFKQRNSWYNPGSFPLYDQAEGEHWLSIEKKFGITYAGMPCFVCPLDNPENWQGHTLHLVYWVTLKDECSGIGCWFHINNLPDSLLPWHAKMIHKAMPFYLEYLQDEQAIAEAVRP